MPNYFKNKQDNKILLIGVNGQIGWELQRSLAIFGTIIPYTRSELDLCNEEHIRSCLHQHAPDIIVNAAAYTAVDEAENQSALAYQINAIAPGIMAAEASKLGALFLHYSTDFVFDGEKQQPYHEKDIPHPINIYGKSKLEGEKIIQAIGGRYLILRTSWVYGLRGHNFLLTMLRLAASKSQLKIVSDQRGAPTWSRFIAEATAYILTTAMSKNFSRDLAGIYHLTSTGSISWYEFAEAIFYYTQNPLNPTLNAISSAEYVSRAKRPAYSVLSNEKIKAVFGIAMPSWDVGLKLCLAERNEMHSLPQKPL